MNNGTLNIGSNAGLGTSNVVVASGATVGLSGTSLAVGNNITLQNNSTLSEANANASNVIAALLL